MMKVQNILHKQNRKLKEIEDMGLNKDAFEFKEETPVGLRRSHDRRKHLSLNEKVEIIYKVLV